MAAGAAIAGVVTAVASSEQQKQARKAEERASDKQERSQDIRARKDRAVRVRQALRVRAQVVAGAEASGAGRSSGILGAEGGIRTRLASDIGSGIELSNLNQGARDDLGDARRRRERSGQFRAIGSAVGSF